MNFLSSLTPWTKRILIIVVGLIIIASMYFGYFDEILLKVSSD